MHIALLQPQSPWGPHVYLPNGLLNLAARLKTADATATLIDLNIERRLEDRLDDLQRADVIGIGALGSPYIPQALELGEELRRLGFYQPLIVGGAPIKNLTPAQFARIFCERVSGIVLQSSGDDLDQVLGLRTASAFDVSCRSALTELPEEYRRKYFSGEWCLFTSQGCLYNCNFCAADKGRPERFRDPDVFADEVDALMNVAYLYSSLDDDCYEIYLTSLDALQNPERMEAALRIVAEAQARNGTRIPLRCLASSKMAVRALNRQPDILKRWRDYGLACIGLGVDGDDPATWAREHKRHNNHSDIAQAFAAMRAVGMRAEALMVIGFPRDTLREIWRSWLACFRLAAQGITVRPYVGKHHVPGSYGWQDDLETVERLLEHPRYFTELEYAGLASQLTHADPVNRYLANAAFMSSAWALKLTPQGCPTNPLFPTESVPAPLGALGHWWNRRMPRDR